MTRFLKVSPQYTSSFVLKMEKTDLLNLLDDLLDADLGEKFTLEIVELSEEDYDNLGEFGSPIIKPDYEMNSFWEFNDEDDDE